MMEDKEYPDWYVRLLDERNDLKTRADKLLEFLQSDKVKMLDPFQACLLKDQWDAMMWYYSILVQRIDSLATQL